jgi:hypothetical protein
MEDKLISEKESLELITRMIRQAKNSYHDTGLSAMMWGGVVAFCALVKFSELRFGYRLPFDIFYLTLVAIIPQIFISVREKRQKKIRTYDDAYMDYIWLGFGISILLMIFVLNVMSSTFQPMANEYFTLAGNRPDFRLYEFTGPLFLILYGIPTFVTGTACKFRPMLWGGLLCWVCCVIACFTEARIDLLLIALSSIVAWFIPGIIMMKEYRDAKKGLAESNV